MRTVDSPLSGVRVLVTRPRAQAAVLAERVREAGGTPLLFPTLAIESVPPARDAEAALAGAELVIFVSPNAATHGYPLLRRLGHPDQTVVAIGRATRAALTESGCPGVYDPGELSSSEDLLAQPILADVSGRRVCIVRGRGGRELLAETLAQRGARVDYLECYRRALPAEPDPGVLERALAADDAPGQALVVTCTSVAGLENLVTLTPGRCRARLLGLPLVVIGERQAAAARQLGWRGSVLESLAGDAKLLETIIDWRRVGA